MSLPVYETAFAECVRVELAAARSGHPPIVSLHEGWAIIKEELDELWDECRKKKERRIRHDVAKELIQIAAMCQRTAEDLGLI